MSKFLPMLPISAGLVAVSIFFGLSGAAGVYNAAVPSAASICIPLSELASFSEDSAGQLSWLLSETALFVTLLATLIVCAAFCIRADSTARSALLPWFLGVLALFAVLDFWFASHYDYGGVVGRSLLSRLARDQAACRSALTTPRVTVNWFTEFPRPVSQLWANSSVPERVLGMSNFLVILVGIGVAFTLSLGLTEGTTLEDLVLWARRFDVLLYLNAVVLVFGVLEVGSLYAWSLAPLTSVAEVRQDVDIKAAAAKAMPPLVINGVAGHLELGDAKAFDGLRHWARVTTITTGLGFSILLLSLYSTASWALRQRALERATADLVFGQTADDLLDQKGFNSDIGSRLSQFSAVLGPLVVGILSALTGLFSKAS